VDHALTLTLIGPTGQSLGRDEFQTCELDLTIKRRVQESLTEIRQKAKTEAEDSLKLKVAEKEQQISSMQRQIDELRRKLS
jgi:hypothetical protein